MSDPLFRTPRWQELRRQALERAGGKCEACGEALGSRPDLHRKVPTEAGIIPDLADIEMRCVPCNTGKRDPTSKRYQERAEFGGLLDRMMKAKRDDDDERGDH